MLIADLIKNCAQKKRKRRILSCVAQRFTDGCWTKRQPGTTWSSRNDEELYLLSSESARSVRFTREDSMMNQNWYCFSTTRSIFRRIWTGEIQRLFEGRTIFMSMFNDIAWTKKGNKLKSVCTLLQKWQHLRRSSSQDTGASRSLRQKWRGGVELATNTNDNGTVSHFRWLTRSRVTLHIQCVQRQNHHRLTSEEMMNKLPLPGRILRTRRFSSRPHWLATSCVKKMHLPVVWYRKFGGTWHKLEATRFKYSLRIARRWSTVLPNRKNLPIPWKLGKSTSPMNLL